MALALGALALGPGALAAQTQARAVLTLDGARQAAAAAVTEARRLNAPGGAIAVVDDGGHLLYLERLDNTFPAAATVAIGKARTAALFRRPTKGLEDAIVGGRTTLLAVAEAPLQGGVPLMVNGVVVGAIGVSGAASAAQDTELAVAGAAAIK
jgi:glc operon protein GlcG